MYPYGRFISFIVLYFTFFHITLCLAANENQTAMQSVRGLKGVYVSIEKIDHETAMDGLTGDIVKKDVEKRLQSSGIPVLSKKEWFDEKGSPYLYVNVNVLKLKATKEYIYSISMAVRQNVYPVRRPVEVIGAATWILGDIIGITPNLNKILASVNDQADAFIKVYLSMNPR